MENRIQRASETVDEIRGLIDEALALMAQRELEYRRKQRCAVIALACFAVVIALAALTFNLARW